MANVDVLGDILARMQQESIVFCHAELSAPWGFAKDRLEGAPFHAILDGCAWVRVDGETALTEIGPGDFIVFPHGDAHALLGEPGSTAVSFTQVLKQKQGASLWQPGTKRSEGPVRMTYGGGGAVTTLVSGVFAFADRRRNPLVAALPRVIHIRQDEGQAVSRMQATLRHLAEEAASGQPGASAITSRLADILFIQAIQAYVARRSPEASGWLRGMTDPQIGLALAAIHARCGGGWTVATLAREAGLSRAGFAARFKGLVGRGPIEYLTDWRMHEAAGLLLGGSCSVSEVADRVGYQSDVAFSKAFKRQTGKSPTAYRAQA